jgi:hypothetical protein
MTQSMRYSRYWRAWERPAIDKSKLTCVERRATHRRLCADAIGIVQACGNRGAIVSC